MNIVELQEKLLGAQKDFVTQLEEAITRVEQEIREASDVEASGRAEWEKSIEGYIDELHNVIFSAISEFPKRLFPPVDLGPRVCSHFRWF